MIESMRTVILICSIPTVVGFSWVAAERVVAKGDVKAVISLWVAFWIDALWFAVLLWR